MSGPTRQSLENLKGEIEFRRKLARQHTTGEMLLPDYFDKDEHDRILSGRIAETARRFTGLQRDGVDFSHFLELGSERGHRALALCNHFSAQGIATDLSLDQLRTATHFAEIFNLPRLPLRVCCDANHLPLRTASVPFAFCYQFLHHFPNLGVILPEIHRVLGRGRFFFDEEPLGRWIQLKLYTQRTKEYSRATRQKGKLLHWLENLISEPPSDEVDHGIIENHSMRLSHWCAQLNVFDRRDIRARTLRHLKSRVGARPGLRNLPALLLGGVIHGLCEKTTGPAASSTDPLDWLACPGCDAPVRREGDAVVCVEKNCRYPVVDDIPVLIESRLRRQLYPELG